MSGSISGGLAINKSDSSILYLGGNNSYTGTTNIYGGTVVVQSATALGNGAVYVFGPGKSPHTGNLQLANITGNVAESIILYDNAQLQNTAGNNGVSGPITICGGIAGFANNVPGTTLSIGGNIWTTGGSGSGLAVSGSGNTTISGNIGGSSFDAGLLKSDTGTLILSGTNTYAGGTTVSDGLLVINRSAALPSGSILSIGASGSVELGDSTLNGTAIPLGGSPSAGTLAPQGIAAGGIHAVPELGTLVLLAAAACGLAIRRKKGI
ncbi:MAG: autotransporter-associated beta strand repeat-containing protein [Thermoguttaceae bacterium]